MVISGIESARKYLVKETQKNRPAAEFNCKVARVVFAILGATSLLSFHPINALFYFGAAYLTHEITQIISEQGDAPLINYFSSLLPKS